MRRLSWRWRRNWTAFLALPLVIAALGGCSSHRFQLSNRDDTKYEKQIAANDVRVPVDGGPPIRVPSSPGLGSAIVPTTPNSQPESFAANVPADPSPFPQGVVPRPADTGPGSRPILAETPRPGPVGTRLDMLAGGPELAGRVVSPVGQPVPRVAIQVLDPRERERVVAEVATDDYGMFRVHNLAPGMPYRLVAASQSADGRLVGSIMATPPDAAVVVQLQVESLISGRSPLGNRLSSNPAAGSPAFDTGGASRPVQLAESSGATGALPGGVTVATAQPLGGSSAPAMAAPGVARVLPPSAARPVSVAASEGAVVTPVNEPETAARPLPNIAWDAAGESSPSKGEPAATEFAGGKEVGLTLPRNGELALPGDNPAGLNSAPAGWTMPKSPVAAPSPAATVAFAGTGLEFAKVLDLEGKQRPVGALAGDFILLDFFGSWCGPCRKAVPHLNDLQSRYSNRGLRVVGIACEYGDTGTAVRTANDARIELGIRYPIVVSPMEEKSELRDHFQVDRYPTVVLIDRSGRVLFQGQGGDSSTFQRLEQAIEQALAGVKVAAR